jgi:Tol biopolymer transport system component
MDFGLAKLKHETAPSDSSERPTEAARELTSAGTVMGTVAYMSPEQVRGESLDERTDLFSLGVVLYEMATGHQAFSGTTTGVVFEGILNREPSPPSESNPAVPAELDRIIGKALEKDKEVRYQTARDLLADLKRLRRDTTSGRRAATAGPSTAPTPVSAAASGPAAVEPAGGRRRGLVVGVALLAVVALGAVALRFVSAPAPLKVEKVVQVTSDHATKGRPLTDGTRLYFSEGSARVRSVLTQVAVTGGATGVIPVPFPAPGLVDLSPDGTELLVLADRQIRGLVAAPSPLWIVPFLGETPRPVGDVNAYDAAWAPDGRTIAYTVGADLFLAGTDGSDPRRIWTAGGTVYYPVWSPDGRRLRLSVIDPKDGGRSLWEVGASGGHPHPVLPGFALSACCGRWSPDGRHYVFSAGPPPRSGVASLAPSGRDLWVLTERGGWLSSGRAEPVRLTQGPLSYGVPVWSRDGRRIFAEGSRQSGELVRCQLGSGECAPHLRGIDAEGVSYSRDGEWVAYVAPDGALWRSRADGTEKLQLTFPPLWAALPQWSPDGRRICFARLETAAPTRLMFVPADGGPVQEALPGEEGSQVDGEWSPDGRRLAFGHLSRGGPQDREIQIADLESGQITAVPGSKDLYSPRWSPDGRHLAALSRDALRLLVFDFSSQRWRSLAEGALFSYPSWARDSASVFVTQGGQRIRIRSADGRREIAHSFEGVRQISRLLGPWVGHAPTTPSWLSATRASTRSSPSSWRRHERLALVVGGCGPEAPGPSVDYSPSPPLSPALGSMGRRP